MYYNVLWDYETRSQDNAYEEYFEDFVGLAGIPQNRKPRPFVWTADPDRIIASSHHRKGQPWAPSDRVRPLAAQLLPTAPPDVVVIAATTR